MYNCLRRTLSLYFLHFFIYVQYMCIDSDKLLIHTNIKTNETNTYNLAYKVSSESTFYPVLLRPGPEERRNMGDQRDFFRPQEMPLLFAQVIATRNISLKPIDSKDKNPVCEHVQDKTNSTTGILISPFHVLTCGHALDYSNITISNRDAQKKLGTFFVCLTFSYLTIVNFFTFVL